MPKSIIQGASAPEEIELEPCSPEPAKTVSAVGAEGQLGSHAVNLMANPPMLSCSDSVSLRSYSGDEDLFHLDASHVILVGPDNWEPADVCVALTATVESLQQKNLGKLSHLAATSLLVTRAMGYQQEYFYTHPLARKFYQELDFHDADIILDVFPESLRRFYAQTMFIRKGAVQNYIEQSLNTIDENGKRSCQQVMLVGAGVNPMIFQLAGVYPHVKFFVIDSSIRHIETLQAFQVANKVDNVIICPPLDASRPNTCILTANALGFKTKIASCVALEGLSYYIPPHTTAAWAGILPEVNFCCDLGAHEPNARYKKEILTINGFLESLLGREVYFNVGNELNFNSGVIGCPVTTMEPFSQIEDDVYHSLGSIPSPGPRLYDKNNDSDCGFYLYTSTGIAGDIGYFPEASPFNLYK